MITSAYIISALNHSGYSISISHDVSVIIAPCAFLKQNKTTLLKTWCLSSQKVFIMLLRFVLQFSDNIQQKTTLFTWIWIGCFLPDYYRRLNFLSGFKVWLTFIWSNYCLFAWLDIFVLWKGRASTETHFSHRYACLCGHFCHGGCCIDGWCLLYFGLHCCQLCLR